jgi:hypothetical protein
MARDNEMNGRGWELKTVLKVGIVLLVAAAGCRGDKNKPPRINTQITGTVKYRDGTPAMGATVGVDGLAVQAVTNKEGKYSLTGIPPGAQIVVALKPGYRPALQRDVNVPHSGRVAGVDLVLEPDPNYVPDQIKIENISPPLDTVFAPGQTVSISFVVRYHLTSADFGTIAITLQDEKNNPLIVTPMSHRITRRTDAVNFTRQVVMPQRIKGEVYVIAALFPGFVASSDISDIVTYKIRAFQDRVKFSTILLVPDPNNPQRVSLSAAVGYTLDTIESGIVRLRVLGDKGKNDFKSVVYETQQNVNKSRGASGALDFQAEVTVPADVTALKVYTELLTSDGKSNLFDVTSKVYPLKKSQ